MPTYDSEPVRLMREYLDAEYRASVDGRDAVLRIGKPPPSWLRHEDLVFITAWNPRSIPRTETQNRAGLAALRDALAPHARVHEAAGSGAGGTWHEPSLLAIGLPFDIADREARRHDQNAIVVARAGGTACLRLYRTDWRAAVEAASLDTRFVEWVASPAPA